MLIQTLKTLFKRDLTRLISELESYNPILRYGEFKLSYQITPHGSL
jgi:hypothetical protein